MRPRKLAPIRVCPAHGQSFRSWKEGARGPCCVRFQLEQDLAGAEEFAARLDPGILIVQAALRREAMQATKGSER